jgi:hypothetical protein
MTTLKVDISKAKQMWPTMLNIVATLYEGTEIINSEGFDPNCEYMQNLLRDAAKLINQIKPTEGKDGTV